MSLAATEPYGLRRHDAFEELREPWDDLARLAGNPFATWEWMSLWWRHFGSRHRLALFSCEDGSGSVPAILPLCLARRGPLRTLMMVGTDTSDQLGPVCGPNARGRAAASLRRAADSIDCDLVLMEGLPDQEGWAAHLDAPVLVREPSPSVAIETTDWEAFLASKSKNLRQQVRSFERRLVRDHALEYRLADDPDRLDRDVESLFELHRMRWGAGSAFGRPEVEAFHRDLAPLALEGGWLRLWLAETHGRPIAARYGFRFAGADWFYQQGRDPGFERESVGFVLLAHTLRDAVEGGMGEFKFLAGGEAYKDRFATIQGQFETVAIARTARGHAMARGLKAAERHPRVRAWTRRALLA